MLKNLLMVMLCTAAGISAATGYTTTIKTGDDCFIQSAKPTATPGGYTMLMAGRSNYTSRGNTKILIRLTRA